MVEMGGMNNTSHDGRASGVIAGVAIAVFVVSGATAVFALRNNNVRMLSLRQAVFDADSSGGDVNAALIELQQYVTTTMNTTLPKLGDEKAIQLKTTYERLKQSEQDRVASERKRINQEATAYCEAALPNVPLTQRVPCVQEYTAARPVVERPLAKELYSFDFVSPRWSADLAGLSLLVAFISLIVGIAALFYRYFLARRIRRYM